MSDKAIYKYFRCPTKGCPTKERNHSGTGKKKCPKCGAACYLTNNWYVTYTDSKGRQREKAITPVYDDAEDFLAEVRRAKRRNELLPGEERDITWEDATELFRAWVDRQKADTKKNYTSRLAILDRHFSGMTLQEISLRHVDDFITLRTTGYSEKDIEKEVARVRRELKRQGETRIEQKITILRRSMGPIAPSTVKYDIHTLLAIYKMMCRRYDPSEAPKLHSRYQSVQLVKLPEADNVKERAATREEFGKILEEARKDSIHGIGTFKGYAYMILFVAIKTCLRPKNIYRLRRSQIDFDAMTITIPRDELKVGSKRPDHVVPIDQELADELRAYMTRKRTFDLLFPSHKDPLQPIKRSCKIDTIIKRLGLNKGVTDNKYKITTYVATRHTGLTWLGEATEDAKTLAAMADHANPAITLKRYVKKSQEKLTNLVNNHSPKLGDMRGEKR